MSDTEYTYNVLRCLKTSNYIQVGGRLCMPIKLGQVEGGMVKPQLLELLEAFGGKTSGAGSGV